jgi:peptidoglycan/xylan/chitin deacetylase (PgdA/CDA1 family)
MRVPGVKSAKTFWRWTQARLLGGALILGYHQITDARYDGYEDRVSPGFFEEQMEALCKFTRPLGLSRLVEYLKDGSVSSRSVVVTFDDGYADNLYHAKPILEKYDVPATIFLCSGYAGKEFWWDELERLVLSSRADPRELRLGKRQFQWNQRMVSPEAGAVTELTRRREFRQALYHFLLPLDIDERNASMEVIRGWAGVLSNESAVHRSMNQEELLQLAEGGLIEIGSHTRNHPMLPQLSVQRQAEEIMWGKQDLEAVVGRPVAGFSYPNGQATRDAKRIVHDLGFVFACTSLQDVVRPGCDIFEMPRFWQRDVDGDRFMRSLNLWLST